MTMSERTRPGREQSSFSAISRRGLLAAGGGVALSAALTGCGSNTGRGSGGSSGRPALSQWYHEYGEAGTEQAVKRYAAAYKKADVRVQWRPGRLRRADRRRAC